MIVTPVSHGRRAGVLRLHGDTGEGSLRASIGDSAPISLSAFPCPREDLPHTLQTRKPN